MTDLIISEFDTSHVAFLARAALGRMQDAMSLPEYDVAVVSAGENGHVRLCESVDVRDGSRQDTFWSALINLLSVAGDGEPNGVSRETARAKLTAVGLEAESVRSFVERDRSSFSALFVLTQGRAMRDQVLGVLLGFQGHILRNTLRGDDREAWLRALSDSDAVEEEPFDDTRIQADIEPVK